MTAVSGKSLTGLLRRESRSVARNARSLPAARSFSAESHMFAFAYVQFHSPLCTPFFNLKQVMLQRVFVIVITYCSIKYAIIAKQHSIICLPRAGGLPYQKFCLKANAQFALSTFSGSLLFYVLSTFDVAATRLPLAVKRRRKLRGFILIFFFSLSGIVAGPVCQRYTFRPPLIIGSVIMWIGIISSSFAPNIFWVSMTQGILFGFGCGLVFMMLPVIINQYFDKYKGLAFGITYSGSTSSAFVFPRLLLFLRETYNFKSSIMIFGAILMHVTAVSLILKEPEWVRKKRYQDKLARALPRQIVYTVENRDAKSASSPSRPAKVGPAPGSLRHGLTVLCCPMFYVVLTSYILFGYNFDVFMATIVDFATDRGSNVSDAVSLIPLFSITDTFGRLCLPVLADRGYLRRSTLAMMNYGLMGAILMILPRVESYIGLLIMCLCLGIFIGCGVSTYPALMADYVDMQRLPISYGLVGTVAGPLFVLKPFFIGYFRDSVGSYDGMYMLLAGGLLALGLLWAAVVCFEKRSHKDWQVEHEGHCINQVAGHSFYCQPSFVAAHSCERDVESLSAAPQNTFAPA
ncbi:unnamed protein product [Ixodes hexagonus]